jgi:hypothetical protein
MSCFLFPGILSLEKINNDNINIAIVKKVEINIWDIYLISLIKQVQ